MSFMYTVVTSLNSSLNKSFDSNGNKSSNALLSYGSYQVEKRNTIEEYLSRLKTLQHNQAIIPGIPKNGTFSGFIASKEMNIPNSITRTKEDFHFNGNHILLFDYDPDDNGFKITSPEHFCEVLREIYPPLKDCKIGVTYGSSYGTRKDGVLLSNSISLHGVAEVIADNNEQVQEFKSSLENETWKKGYGFVKISKSGSLLQRGTTDGSVIGSQNLYFEANPTLAEGITQLKPDDYFTSETGVLDLTTDIIFNDAKGKTLFEEAKLLKKDEAKIIRDKYIEDKSNELASSQNITKELAVQTIKRKVSDGVLTADDILNSKDGIVKVSDIFLNPQQYKNLQVLDPINPINNEFVAMVYVNDNSIIVHSFKSGGVNYKLVANEEIIEEICNKVIGSTTVDNKKFVTDIVSLCDGAEVPQEFRKEMANTLKGKKIVSSMKELNTRVMKIPFPDFKYVDGEIRLLNTIDNLDVFLKYNNIDVRYDEILKEGIIRAENAGNFNKQTDDMVNSQFIKIKSEAIKVGLPERIIDYLPALIDSNSYNPLMEMVKSKEWDGKDRVSEVISCLGTDDDSSYVKQVVTLWLTQCIAAWDYIKDCPIDEALPRFESVLTAVGSQGLSKTRFFEGLLPKKFRKYVRAGHNLDAHNKDSIKLAICSGICEYGELEVTFARDIGSLKSFQSLAVDKFRLPYQRSETSFPRRTSFCASVNDSTFLIDPTGNRRFLPIHLISIDYDKYMKIDKQQLWSQLYANYKDGSKWWIDENEDKELYEMLNKKHSEHMMISPVDDIIEKVIADTLGYGNAVQSDPLGILIPKPINNTDFTHTDYVYKTATEISNHFKLASGKRGNLAKIKSALAEAGIEQKGNTFKVRLVS